LIFFQDNLVSQHQKGRTILDFNEARDDEVAVELAGPYANHLHLAPNKLPCQHPIAQMLFLMPNQQCQSTKGNI